MRTASLVLVFIIALLAFSMQSGAGDAILSWGAPTTNADGTPLTDLAGYKVYYGTTTGNYPTVLVVGNVLTHTVTGLIDGTTYYFAATAYDTSGNESDYSNEVSKTISSSPLPPSITLTATGNGGSVTASWTAASGAAGYQISIISNATGYIGIIDVGTATAYVANGLKPASYSVSVKGYDVTGATVGVSAVTTITLVADTMLPNDVILFTATPYTTGVRLSWTNPADKDLAQVILEYRIGSGSFLALATLKAVPGMAQTHDHLNLAPGTYNYAIHTRDTSGNTTHTAFSEITIGSAVSSSGSNKGGSGCFIATAAYGSYLDSHVVVLRQFRDNYLLTNEPGKFVVAMYYALSPPLANFIARHDTLKGAVRIGLTPMIFAIEYPNSATLLFTAFIGSVLLIRLRKKKQ